MNSIIEVQLAEEGLNEVDVPKGAKLLTVAVGGGFNPALYFRGDRSAANEKRRFYVARQAVEEIAGDYIGTAQPAGRAALHVFGVGEETKKPKK